MRIIGIDPGTGRLGWAIIDKDKGELNLVDCGCLETPANTSLEIRLELIYYTLSKVIKKFKPDTASVEDLFFFKNQKTVISVAGARGVVLLACQKSQIPIKSYTPLQIKSALTGYGTADKKQVEFMVKQTLKVKELKQLDDTVDAIAAALTEAFRHTSPLHPSSRLEEGNREK